MIENLLNTVNEVIDYDMIANGTVFVLVKSEKGNYSIRQAFRNGEGRYNGFSIVKLMRKADEQIARLNFEELIASIR